MSFVKPIGNGVGESVLLYGLWFFLLSHSKISVLLLSCFLFLSINAEIKGTYLLQLLSTDLLTLCKALCKSKSHKINRNL